MGDCGAGRGDGCGGCFSSYYRWQEAVGPRERRRPMLNLLWGGIESNQVGTAEFVNYCRQVGADALVCVNFESDGRKPWMKDPNGNVRAAGPEEAAEWVDYGNRPEKPGPPGGRAARALPHSAVADRQRDLLRSQYLAFHHMYAPGGSNSPLRGNDWRKDPARTWAALMEAYKPHEAKICAMREQAAGTGLPLALTECHFALPGPNRNPVLSSWAAGVSMARLLNAHTRHGDWLKIATVADFCGTRWQNNAILIDGARAYMQPVARVMSLYRHHVGQQVLNLLRTPADLDVTASRTGNQIFPHVVNTQRARSVPARVTVAGMTIRSGSVFEIAVDPDFEVWAETRNVIAPRGKDFPAAGSWSFPPASVSALEL